MSAELPEYVSDALLREYAASQEVSLNGAVRLLLKRGHSLEQFQRNKGLLSTEMQAILMDMPIFLAGCGGLGGEMAAHLVQMGAGNLYLCDFDVYEESNLNRQRYCEAGLLGREKAEVTAEALFRKSPWGKFTPVIQKITSKKLPRSFLEASLIVDCLDSVQGKKMLQDAALAHGKAWLHGAVLQNEGFARLEAVPSGFLDKFYGESTLEKGAGSVLSHVVAGTAAVMSALFVKWLHKPDYSSPLLHIDFSIPEMESFEVA